jgi:hypothetical protein
VPFWLFYIYFTSNLDVQVEQKEKKTTEKPLTWTREIEVELSNQYVQAFYCSMLDMLEDNLHINNITSYTMA